MKWLYPVITGRTFFDTSTIIHLAFWIFFGSCLTYSKVSLHRAILGSFLLAALWEVFERFAEKKWPTVWLHPEGWLNAWVSDPLTVFIGVGLAYWLVSKQ